MRFDDPKIRRGMILLEKSRFKEAAAVFQESLAEDPHNPQIFYLLARCGYHAREEGDHALEYVDKALGIDPLESLYHQLRALILVEIRRAPEALAAIERALELDPESAQAYGAKGYILIHLQRWADAERAARRALEFDADDLFAGNILAAALRLQNKLDENQHLVSDMLARDPENAASHANAGWVLVSRGDYAKANTHFREALRLAPSFEPARIGMLETFKAKSPVYRLYIRYSLFMSRLPKNFQLIFILGIFVLYRILRSSLQATAGHGKTPAFLLGAVTAVYAVFFLWTWLSAGVGNLIVLLDKTARHSLKKMERMEAVFVGGFFLGGLAVLGLETVIPGYILTPIAVAAILSAVPFALTFTNEHPWGQNFYGGMGVFIWIFGLASTFNMLMRGPELFNQAGLLASLVIFVAATWLGGFGLWRR